MERSDNHLNCSAESYGNSAFIDAENEFYEKSNNQGSHFNDRALMERQNRVEGFITGAQNIHKQEFSTDSDSNINTSKISRDQLSLQHNIKKFGLTLPNNAFSDTKDGFSYSELNLAHRNSKITNSSAILDSYITENKLEFLKNKNYNKKSYPLSTFDYNKLSSLTQPDTTLDIDAKSQLLDSLRRNRCTSITEHKNVNRFITPPSNTLYKNMLSQTHRNRLSTDKSSTNNTLTLHHYDTQSLVESRNIDYSSKHDRKIQIQNENNQAYSSTGYRRRSNRKSNLFNDFSSLNQNVKNDQYSASAFFNTPKLKKYLVGSSSRDIENERKQAIQKSFSTTNHSFDSQSNSLVAKINTKDDFTQLRFINQPLFRRNSLSSKIPDPLSPATKKSHNKRHTFQLSRDLNLNSLKDLTPPKFSSAEQNKQKKNSSILDYEKSAQGFTENYNKYAERSDPRESLPLTIKTNSFNIDDHIYSPLSIKGSSLISNTLSNQDTIQEFNDSHSYSKTESDSEKNTPEADIKEMNSKIQNLHKENFDLKINNKTLIDSLNQLSQDSDASVFMAEFLRSKAINNRANQKIEKYQSQILKLKNEIDFLSEKLSECSKCNLDHGMSELEKLMFKKMENKVLILEEDLVSAKSDLKMYQEIILNFKNENLVLKEHLRAAQDQIKNELKILKFENANSIGGFNPSYIYSDSSSSSSHNKATGYSKRCRAGTIDTNESFDPSENSEITCGAQNAAINAELTLNGSNNQNNPMELLRIIQNLKKNKDSSIEKYDKACRRYESELAKFDEKLSKTQTFNEYLKDENSSLEKDKYILELKNSQLEHFIKKNLACDSKNENTLNELSIERLMEKVKTMESELDVKNDKIKSLNQELVQVTDAESSYLKKKDYSNTNLSCYSNESFKSSRILPENLKISSDSKTWSDTKDSSSSEIPLLSPDWHQVDNAQFERSLKISDTGHKANNNSYYKNARKSDANFIAGSVDDIHHLSSAYSESSLKDPKLAESVGLNAQLVFENKSKASRVASIRKIKPFGPYV
ncbi:hypothetical protein BB561_000134 [Smittium simulii]|uniref:Centrosomin N-terminal motif 1 domain-containing protein n=1 Tax=Smittium simulii TaxID=133385 RepID=A0A2T9Z0A8_9FUNG|nr:hypothetical protein BB561_000134 [Smittium simulii]